MSYALKYKNLLGKLDALRISESNEDQPGYAQDRPIAEAKIERIKQALANFKNTEYSNFKMAYFKLLFIVIEIGDEFSLENALSNQPNCTLKLADSILVEEAEPALKKETQAEIQVADARSPVETTDVQKEKSLAFIYTNAKKLISLNELEGLVFSLYDEDNAVDIQRIEWQVALTIYNKIELGKLSGGKLDAAYCLLNAYVNNSISTQEIVNKYTKKSSTEFYKNEILDGMIQKSMDVLGEQSLVTYQKSTFSNDIIEDIELRSKRQVRSAVQNPKKGNLNFTDIMYPNVSFSIDAAKLLYQFHCQLTSKHQSPDSNDSVSTLPKSLEEFEQSVFNYYQEILILSAQYESLTRKKDAIDINQTADDYFKLVQHDIQIKLEQLELQRQKIENNARKLLGEYKPGDPHRKRIGKILMFFATLFLIAAGVAAYFLFTPVSLVATIGIGVAAGVVGVSGIGSFVGGVHRLFTGREIKTKLKGQFDDAMKYLDNERDSVVKKISRHQFTR